MPERPRRGAPKTRRPPRPDARRRPLPRAAPREPARGGGGALRRAVRAAPPRPRPALHVGPAPVRPRRPDRRGRRRGRPHLDHDGRPLRPAAPAHPERGAGAVPAGDRAAWPRPASRGARPRERPRQAAGDARTRDARRRRADQRRWAVASRPSTWGCCGTPPRRIIGSTSSTSRPRRGAWSTRTIEPEEVFSSLGNWYVVGLGLGRRRRAALPRRPGPNRGRHRPATFEPRGLTGAGRDLYTPGSRRRSRPPPAPRRRAMDRRVLRHDRRRRARRRLARGDPARAEPGMGRDSCSCAWDPMPRSSHPAALRDEFASVGRTDEGALPRADRAWS